MKKERIFYLDFVRAISVLFVIIAHFNSHLGIQKITTNKVFTIIPVDYAGKLGVSLFIIISGAALMYTYAERIKLKEFFIKRFWVIYPSFWIGYIMTFLFTFYMNGSYNHGAPK